MSGIVLEPDCAACAGLCCVGLVFVKGDEFAFDKQVGVPCPHPQADNRCDIYFDRPARGMTGCVGHNCLGAGQRATAMFDGRSWRDGQSVAVPMFTAFWLLRELHELYLQVMFTAGLPLTAEQRIRITDCGAWLNDLPSWSYDQLLAFAAGPRRNEIRVILRELSAAATPSA